MDRNRSLAATTHGMSGTATYRIWRGILNRCLRTNDAAYKNYGGRGITVCKRWRKFENFLKDMGIRPEGLSIDRINNNKGYCKSNCRWETILVQCNNTRLNVKLRYEGVTLSISEWGRKLLIPQTMLRERYYRGWSTKRILTTPNLRPR